MTVAFEDVRRCPACEQPGESHRGGRLGGAARGSSSIRFYCRNERCRWYNTGWIVEIMPDNTIHPPVTSRPKQFTALPTAQQQAVVDSLQTLYEMSLIPGSEIRRSN